MRQPRERTEVDALVPKACVGAASGLPAVAERALARALEAAPDCTTGRPGDADDLLGGIRRIVEIVLRCVAEDGQLSSTELASIEMLGAQRARLGMVESAFLALLDAVQEELLDALHHEIAGVDAAPGVAVRASRVTSRLVGELGRQLRRAALGAYDRAVTETLPRDMADEAALVDIVLGCRVADERATRDAAERLGRRLGPLVGQVVLLGHEGDDHASLRKRAVSLPHPVRGVLRGPVAWAPVVHLPILVSCASSTEWSTLLGQVDAWLSDSDALAVALRPSADLEEAADSYLRTRDRLRWTPATAMTRGIVDSRRLDFLELLGGASEAGDSDRFVDDLLGPVLDRPEATELLELLDVTYRCSGGVAVVAGVLHRHRNTVRKQMAKIESLLGLSLDRPADRHLIDTALGLRRMRRPDSASRSQVQLAR